MPSLHAVADVFTAVMKCKKAAAIRLKTYLPGTLSMKLKYA